MVVVYADIELTNGDDLALVRRFVIREDEVRRMTLSIRVDTQADMLCINEDIQQQLQFPFIEKRKAALADGRILECDAVSSVLLRFKNRNTSCVAMVLPGDAHRCSVVFH